MPHPSLLPLPALCASPIEPVSAFAAHAKSAWARLMRKVYEADPLECPKCKGPMRIIALIDDPPVVRRILEHLGLCAHRIEPGRGVLRELSGGANLADHDAWGKTTPELHAVRASFGSYALRLPGAREKSGIDLAICPTVTSGRSATW